MLIPDSQRVRSRDPSPALFGFEPAPVLQRYACTDPSLAGRCSLYSDLNGLPVDSCQVAGCLPPDPAVVGSQGINGTLPRGMMLRHESSPAGYGAVATPRLPYDPAYDPSGAAMIAATPAPLTTGIPSHPSAAMSVDSKRMVDPSFLALLRAEGLSESTITLLLQQGFDSTAMLAMMEDHDVRAVAPNLGQARVLSRVVLNCKTGATGDAVQRMRARSNSFTHRNDLYMQPQGITMDPHLTQPPPSALQAISPRMGEFLGRRPSSAPSQHLLETTTSYQGGVRPLAGIPVSPGAYAAPLTQPRSLGHYNAHTGLAMSALGQQPPQVAPGTPGAAPKTFSGTYSPMELMKRASNLPPLSPAHSPHHSPQLMRKGAAPVENAVVPASTTLQTTNTLNPANQKLTRRTGPPVIVSTMASPDTSNIH